MMTNLAFLKIYPDAIDDAIESCEDAMKELGFTISEIDDMNDYAMEDLKEIGSFADITNSIISAYYHAAASMIEDKYPGISVDYYVNCHDSPFTVDKPEITDPSADWETALKSMPYSDISEAIGWEFSEEDLNTLMELHKADICREQIEDLLEDCNFHTDCENWHDGNYVINEF